METAYKMKAKKMMTYRWVIYGCLIAIYFLVFFHRMSLGIIKDDLMSSFSMSATTFANLGAMYFYAYMLMQIPAGILADTLGTRKTVAAGSLVTAISTVVFALSHTIILACIARFLLGLGLSVTYVCILKTITQWFKEKEFATMVGLTGFLGNMGGIFAGAPLALMVAAFSWRYTFITFSLFSLVLSALCLALVRNKPEDMGFPSINKIEDRADLSKEHACLSVKEGLLNVLNNRNTWLAFIILGCYYSVYYTFAGTWGVSYIRTVYHLGNIQASEYITILAFGMSLGYLLVGFISDRLKSRKIPLISLGILVNILWFVLLFCNAAHLTQQLFRIMMFFLGIFTACYSLTFSLGKEANDPKYAGMALSVVNLGAFLGGAAVPILVGHIFDRYQGLLNDIELFQKGFIICLILNGIALAASILIKETRCKNIYFN